MKVDAVVIGAGPNGLTAAATLAKGGRRVLVLESANEIGGHTRAIEFAPGFRSPLNEDCGWIPPRVAKAIGVDYESLKSVTRSIWMSVAAADGGLMMLSTQASDADMMRVLSPRDVTRWPEFSKRFAKFAAILAELYQLVPPDIDTKVVGEVLPLLGVGRKLRGLGRADMIEFLRVMPMSVQDLLDDTFETELFKAAIASRAIRDIQQGPRSAGTTFNLLHYLVGSAATYAHPRLWFLDGPDAFAKAAADACRRLRAEIRTGSSVERVKIRDGAVTGVVLATGEEIETDVVVSTADPKRTLLGMVDPVWLDPEFMLAVNNIKLRGCSAYVLFGVNTQLDDANKTFASTVSLTSTTTALEKAADAAKYGEVSAEPHVEFFAPSLRWPHLAPAGKHVVTARVQYAPYRLKDGEWDTARSAALGDKAAAAIARVIPGFESSIEHRAVLTPRDIETQFGVTEGALTQGEMTLDQIMFMRPVPGWGHYAMPIDGLYLGGAGAHPGPGVLGGAGYLAANAALQRRS